RSLAARFHDRTLPTPAARGAILARDGKELATNILARDLCANPRVVADPATTARALSELFGGDAADYKARPEKEAAAAFVYLKRGLERERADAQSKALEKRSELAGIELRPAPRRAYPGGTLASQVLGYVNIDNQGIEGMELFFNPVLGGKDGFVRAE